MADYVRAVGTVVKTLWDLIPSWGITDRESRGSSRTQTTRAQNGIQSNNNNGIYSISRKRKSEHPDCHSYTQTTGTEFEYVPCPKYQRLIQTMSQEKQKRYGYSIPNGKAESKKISGFPYSSNTPTLLKAAGVRWETNTSNTSKPFGLRASLQADEKNRGFAMSSYSQVDKSRQNHKVVEGLMASWDSDDESNKRKTTLTDDKHISVKSSLPKRDTVDALFMSKPMERNGPVSSLFFSKPRHSRLFSTPSVQKSAKRFTTSALPKPVIVDLVEENEVEIIDSKPKIFSTPSVDHFRSFNSRGFYPSVLSTASSNPTSPSQPPNSSQNQNESTNEDEDDDLIVIAEKIISPKYNPFRMNSLELETRSSKYREKSWLNETHAAFHDNRKFREDRIDYEAKKLAILKNRSMLSADIERRIRDNLTLTGFIILEEEEAKLPELTPEMKECIDLACRGREADVVIVTASNIQVVKGDLKTLAPGQWLNDNVINSFMDLICVRSNSDSSLPKVHVFSTFFYPKYLKEGYSNILKRWTRKVDIFAVDLLVFPIHLGVHWCLAVADHRTKTLKFYDSLFGNHMRALEALLSYMASEHKERKKSDLMTSQWKLSLETEIPGQENGSDCGVFTCQFAEYLSRDVKLSFTQKQMPYFRQRMIYETVKQKILSD